MDGFFERLKQRKLVQWALAYVAAAFALIQVLDIVAQHFGWPEGAMRLIIIALSVGVFVAVVLAWYHGERGTQSVTGTELLILALLFVIGGAVAWRIGPSTQQAAASSSETKPAAADIPHKSIAVLPFTDLSPNRDQEYFSDGMAEEILDALAKVKDLKVAGRTSSFSFKGRNEDLRGVGKMLGVANILEGSVRKQGDRVRITAQLIRSEDDFHLWSESYDGDLSDVFALQERIARAITDQLKVVLQGEQKTRLVPIATVNPEAYPFYLQATAIFDRRDILRYDEAIKALQQAVKLDPNYARAYARLASMHVLLGTYTNVNLQAAHDALVHYAQTATALDPTLAEPYAALGFSYGKFPGRAIDQRKAFDRALELDPDDVTTNFWYGLSLVKTGYTRRGIELIEHALAIDPMYPNGLRWRGILYYYAGDRDRAYQYLKRARDLGLGFADRELADLAFAHGDHAEAVRLATAGQQFYLSLMPSNTAEVISRGLYGDPAERASAVSMLKAYLAQPHEHIPGMIPHEMARLGEPAAALHAAHTQLLGDTTDLLVLLWNAQGKPMRELPEFPVFLRDFGLIDLWDTYGEPDVCKRRAPGDYDCG